MTERWASLMSRSLARPVGRPDKPASAKATAVRQSFSDGGCPFGHLKRLGELAALEQRRVSACGSFVGYVLRPSSNGLAFDPDIKLTTSQP